MGSQHLILQGLIDMYEVYAQTCTTIWKPCRTYTVACPKSVQASVGFTEIVELMRHDACALLTLHNDWVLFAIELSH